MRCNQCQAVCAQMLYSRDGDYILQLSLRALKVSAEIGCDFCLLVYTSLANVNRTEDIETHLQISTAEAEIDTDAAIKVAAQLDDGPRQEDETLSRPQIYVLSGRSIETSGTAMPYISSSLSVFAKHDDPAACHLHGREVLSDPAADSTFARVQERLNVCDEQHDCLSSHNPELPTRYLDVGPSDGSVDPVLRVNTAMERGRYAALSYSWGPAQTIVTTMQNLDCFRRGIKSLDLAQSLQDAILVTRKFGLRFLWIDALCIVQQEPDLADFLCEAPKMGWYYHSAYVTIAAGCSADSELGFLRRRPTPKVKPCALKYSVHPKVRLEEQGSGSGTVYACLQASRSIGPLQTRAWTFQEAELSPRLLVYGQEQVYLACQKRQAFEDGSVVSISWTVKDHDHVLPSLILAKRDTRPGGTRLEILRRWCRAVHVYSMRNMKEPLDKLTALAGMAEFIAETIQSDYLFGIWAGDLTRGLLWSSTVTWLPKAFHIPLKRPLETRAPSWSWASIDGPVQLPYSERTEEKYCNAENQLIKLVSHNVSPRTFDPIRNKSPFELTVLGKLIEVKISQTDCQQYKSTRLRWRRAIRVVKNGLLECMLLEPAKPVSQEPSKAEIVGLGLLDVREDAHFVRLHVLPLVSDEGLLLVESGTGTFRRIGTFWPEDQRWFLHGEAQNVILI